MHFARFIYCRASLRLVCALIAVFVLAAAGTAASAGNAVRHTHASLHLKRHMLQDVVLPELGILSELMPDQGPRYQLRLTRQGGEIVDITYRVGDTYLLGALDTLNQYLRDSHNGEVKTYDPRTFDLLHTMRCAPAAPPTRRSTHSILRPPRSISGLPAFRRRSCATRRFRSARAASVTTRKVNSSTSIRAASASGPMRRTAADAAPDAATAIAVNSTAPGPARATSGTPLAA